MYKNKDYKDYSKYKVLDKFTISGQEYVMIQPEKEDTKTILFLMIKYIVQYIIQLFMRTL